MWIRPIVEARAEDVSTIEGIVTASYETISGGVGVPRQWGRDRTLFDPNSRSVAIHVDAKTGAIKTESMTEQDFADRSDASLVKDGFTERELKHVIKRFGNVATVLSSYEGSASGKVIERGVNIFQLYFDGKRWWILSMVWDEERPRQSDSQRVAVEFFSLGRNQIRRIRQGSFGACFPALFLRY